MNLNHEFETPIGTLKIIFASLKEDGVQPERMEKNADASFSRMSEILENFKTKPQNDEAQYEH